jgi:hypothetical protein
VANTLAYNDFELITAVERFIVHAVDVNLIKLLLVIDATAK